MAYAVACEHERSPFDRFYLESRFYAVEAMLAVELFGQPVRHVAEVGKFGLWIGESFILAFSPLGTVGYVPYPVEAFDRFLA